MRHQSSGRRSRNRGGNRRGNQNRSHVFDSNGPEVRIRGTAHQIHEKYIALAKDAAGSGDRILEQSYLQHAEHYQRFINGWEDELRSGKRDNRQAEQEQGEENNKSQAGNNQSGNKKPDKARQKQEESDLGLPSSIVGSQSKEEEFEDA